MKKILFLFIVFLAFFHPATKAAQDVKYISFYTQEHIASNFNQSSNHTDFIGTDLLELAEDDISHFEKKFIAVLKSASTNRIIFFQIPINSKKTQASAFPPFLGKSSSIQAFISVFRI